MNATNRKVSKCTTIAKKTTKAPTKKMTLLEHLEEMVELTGKSKLSDTFYTKVKPHAAFVAKFFRLTENQAVFFAVFMNNAHDSSIRLKDISTHLDCSPIRLMRNIEDIDELVKRRLVRRSCRDRNSNYTYRIPAEVQRCIMYSKPYKPASTKNLSADELLMHISELFQERSENELSTTYLVDELVALLNDNRQLLFASKMLQLKKQSDDDDDFLLALFFCHKLINEDDDEIYFSQIEVVYDDDGAFRCVKRALRNLEHTLLEKGVIECINSDGFGSRDEFKLTEKAKEDYLSEFSYVQKLKEKSSKELIKHDKIVEKMLYYNEREQKQVGELAMLLDASHFGKVQERLTQKGMRAGFPCIFYGAPGTGKTETALQIARRTGRDIMQVNIAETKSMWFGESEKKIKAVFDKYRTLIDKLQTAPILLFNEADAIFGKRKTDAQNSSAVDQTENAIQNIILQEMETLNGILIATTNLTQNLDKAFERRFLYKIEFGKPAISAKQSIWKTMLPDLPDPEALQLAQRYDFSGGQIENIARKHMVENIISGTTPTFEMLCRNCDTECLSSKTTPRRIGFQSVLNPEK
jgi:SpoVK/Ycf46/Vps4 family AAA+-type ATPase